MWWVGEGCVWWVDVWVRVVCGGWVRVMHSTLLLSHNGHAPLRLAHTLDYLRITLAHSLDDQQPRDDVGHSVVVE